MTLKQTILIALVLGVMGKAEAQTKIGNITIPDSIAKAYFLDCYNRPDTARFESMYMLTNACGDEQNRQAEERNAIKAKDCIEVFNWGCPIPRKPTEIDFIKYLKITSK